ncbi:Hypothetical protein AT6N2_L1600 [Agrobacterium tumefaciens]|uniref:hypothetical protein n=1 Tax=Agrobacterium tumefaciens TaxID=358 RepID=UPI001ADD296A|nr:hypothetical protein [Agrobacterium tumefaciens]QTK82344.1 Hypothetical protein AT6N2_L1600 [Agrobacterium tumefaciens]
MLNERIVISGDLTRVDENMAPHQAGNIAWFSRIFTPVLEGLGCSVDTIGAGKEDFPLERLLQSIYDPTVGLLRDQWAASYDNGLPPRVSRELIEALGAATFLLFEAPPSMMAALDAAGHVYLNFRVHPIRFASDLVFAIKTNDKGIARRLKRFAMESDFVKREVELCRKRWENGKSDVPSKSTLFMAQTFEDASLIESGKFLRINDFAEKLRDIVRAEDPIFYKRHPLERNQASFDFWNELFPRTVEISADVSTYELFCKSDDLRIVTISSGSAYEATLFGHSASYLSPRNWGGEYYLDYIPISHEYWYSAFWKDILTEPGIIRSAIQYAVPRRRKRDDLPFVEGRLRTLINVEWSKR